MNVGPTQLLNTYRAHFTQVYQVTRAGHEHCDVTEGVLLDITPLIVDGRKLVTLYDKDLTEGTNLLIGEYTFSTYTFSLFRFSSLLLLSALGKDDT